MGSNTVDSKEPVLCKHAVFQIPLRQFTSCGTWSTVLNLPEFSSENNCKTGMSASLDCCYGL